MSRVGNVYKLKRPCLNNKQGVRGVCFYDYGDGFQVIFPNGKYDGFSSIGDSFGGTGQTEADFILEQVGHDSASANYEFKHVIQVERDLKAGRWNWKRIGEI